MSRRGWVLFSAMSVIWGVPYLLIKVAVAEVSPPVLVATRTGLAALVLLPLAVMQGAVRPAISRWRPLLAFIVLEMAGPWILLAHAEQELPSSLAGLLVATAPLVGAAVSVFVGDREVLRPSKLLGLVTGLAGVALVVGFGREGGGDMWHVIEVLLVAVGYAVAPFIAARHLKDVPAIGVIGVSLAVVAALYAVPAVLTAPDHVPPASALWSLGGLAFLCTGVAFIVFFALIDEVGPTRATLITFANPAVAVSLGILLLDEPLTVGLLFGFPLVLVGCWLSSREHAVADAVIEAPVP